LTHVESKAWFHLSCTIYQESIHSVKNFISQAMNQPNTGAKWMLQLHYRENGFNLSLLPLLKMSQFHKFIKGFKNINASLYLNYRQLKSNKILSKHEDSQFHSIVCFPILAADQSLMCNITHTNNLITTFKWQICKVFLTYLK